MEQFESSTRGSAKSVNGLVGISDGEDVPFAAGEPGKNLDLGEIGVLEFVDQDEPGAGTGLSQPLPVTVQQRVGASDHVTERAQVLFL